MQAKQDKGLKVKSRYLLIQKAEAALIEEKAEKLFGVTRLLDSHLKGDFEDLLSMEKPSVSGQDRESKIAALCELLGPFVDMVALAYRGAGVGYYSKDLKAIVAYGPKDRFGSKVGLDLGPNHLGWQAMETGKETVGVGSMVRGEIMNCMRPLVRNGEPIGFVWANETLEDIYAQIRMGARDVFFSESIEPLLGLTGLLLFASRVLLKDSAETDPANTAASLEKLVLYLKLFLNSLSLAVILSGPDGLVSFVSAGIQDILGRPPTELKGIPVRQMLKQIGICPHFALDDSVDGAKDRFANVLLNSLGESKLVTVVSTAVAFDGRSIGEKSGHIIILEDLKEARDQEERLERIERLAAVGELASAIAHEIKNPLTVIKGAISLVPGRLDDREYLKQFTSIAGHEIDRIDKTVESLLNFSRFSLPQMFEVDVIKTLKRACDLVEPYAKINNAEVTFAYPEGTFSLMGDSGHLVQAFMNLFLNGIQAMPEGGAINVSASVVPGTKYITITVSDSGLGIAPEHEQQIFDVFFTTRKGGTGLGLPLVQRIIYEHQGFLEVSSAPGRGTCFVIKLPLLNKEIS